VRPIRAGAARVVTGQAGVATALADLAQLGDPVVVRIGPGAGLEIVLQRVHVQHPIDADLEAVAAVAGLERRVAIAGRVVDEAGAPYRDVLLDRARFGNALRRNEQSARRGIGRQRADVVIV